MPEHKKIMAKSASQTLEQKAKQTEAKEQSDTKEKLEETAMIRESGQVQLKTKRGNIHCLTIIGQIEGHVLLPPQNKTTKYEHVIPQLIAIEEDPNIDGLIVILNTVGGDVEAGLAIAEMIASMKKPTVSLVLGGGHSIGVPLAVASDYSFIVPSATMTIHPIRMSGLVIGVVQTFEYFDKMQDRVVRFITKNSRIKKDELRDLMLKTGEIANDVGTILFGEDAVQVKLIDSLGGLEQALDKLYEMIEARKEKEDREPSNEEPKAEAPKNGAEQAAEPGKEDTNTDEKKTIDQESGKPKEGKKSKK